MPIRTAGAEALMAKLMEFEVAPPGARTLTEGEPALAIKPADTVAVSCVVEPNVVVSAEPFQSRVSPETKLVPVIVRVKPAPPAVALAGERELTVGAGGGSGGETVNVTVKSPGDPCAPAPVIVTWPLYVPAVNPMTVVETAKFCGAVPVLGETPSHTESVESVKVSAPFPILVKVT